MLSNAFQKNNLSINKFANLKLHTTQSNSLNAFYNIILFKKKSIIIKHIGDTGTIFLPTEFDGRTCTIAAKGRHLADICCHDTNMLS